MVLMELSEYEEIKGELSGKEEAFEKGQTAALAYMADCLGVSPAFCGMEGVVRKIESGRKLKDKSFEEWKAANSGEIEELADYFMAHDTENHFTGERYKDAYAKIESLCYAAFTRR